MSEVSLFLKNVHHAHTGSHAKFPRSMNMHCAQAGAAFIIDLLWAQDVGMGEISTTTTLEALRIFWEFEIITSLSFPNL